MFNIEDYVEDFSIGTDEESGNVVITITLSNECVYNAPLRDAELGYLKAIDNHMGDFRRAITNERG